MLPVRGWSGDPVPVREWSGDPVDVRFPNATAGGEQWQPPLPPGPVPPALQPDLNVGPQQAAQQGGHVGPGQPPRPLGPALPAYGAQQGPVPGPPPLPPVGGQPAVQVAPGQQILLPHALQQLLAALGVPAPAVESVAPVVPAAAIAPGRAGEARGLRGPQDITKAIRRIHDKMDGKATGPIYKGTSSAALSIHNNPVLFQDKVSKVLSTTDGGSWALTPDRATPSGLSHRRPELDSMTPLRRELLQEFIGDHLGTHDELTSTEIVEVPAIDGSFARVQSQEVSATEWLRKLVREGMLQSGAREAAAAALNNIKVGEAEAWKAASRRLVLVYRAYLADPVRPHISEATYFWRYINEEQLGDLLERLVHLLLPSAIDQTGLQGVVHERIWRIAVEVRPMMVDYANPTSSMMTQRGVKTEGFFTGMVDLISTRQTVYGQPARDLLKGNGGPSPRLASIGSEAMASARRMFRQARPDIAAMLGRAPGRGAGGERLAAMGDDGDDRGQPGQGPLAGGFRDLHDGRGYDVVRQPEAGADSFYPEVAAFTNQAASTPGRHGVPFAKRGPATRPPVAAGAPGSFSQGTNTGEGARPAASPGVPRADAPRHERAAFLAKHRICFSFAFEGACPRQDCVFTHDPALIPPGHFKGQASRKRVAREGGREVSRPKRRLYALSEEQAHVVAAYFDEDMEAVGGQGADEPGA